MEFLIAILRDLWRLAVITFLTMVFLIVSLTVLVIYLAAK